MDLSPVFTTRVRFRLDEVLPPEDPVAQWIVNLARGLDDLMIANVRLRIGFAENTDPTEHFYDIRAIAVHSWELAKFLRESEQAREEVAAFMSTLDDRHREDYAELSEALSEPAESDSRVELTFKRNLSSARDQSTHYSRIDHKLLRRAMKRIGDQEGELSFGERFKDFRSHFAADVGAQMFFAMKGDEEPFREFADKLNEVVLQLVRYAQAAIRKYFEDRHRLLSIEEYAERRTVQDAA